ncbi:VanZ family protein [Thioalkalivibrio sp. XN279]|uniref:VanZ family protein n=1 Tax=Thioalkalivibrio sp. XN279 TaxID=2714953 RepID=UPI00140D62EC|nr:VanZ family protein [Thioalkalivibrio sp. XN279]NHA13506.1 VanZ family protein [Thioalkalivibrio sp. XN279]
MDEDADMPPRPLRDWRHQALPALGIVALMLFLALVRPPGDAYGWRTLFEIGHVPLFGVAGLLMLRIVRARRGSAVATPPDFLIALLATAILSLAAEAFQVFQPGRDANVGDAGKNLLGAVCFLAIAAAVHPGLWQRLGKDGPTAARMVLVAAALTLALALAPVLGVAWHYAQRAAAFPLLADFTASWQRPFLSLGRSELESVRAPDGWDEMAGREVSRLTFLDAPWPGVTVREPWPDWSAYATLRFQVWSELEQPVEIVLRVDDTHRERDHADRFNGSFIVVPGLNDFSIPLHTVADGPRARRLDLADISQFILFSRRPGEPFALYFGPVWLEGEPNRIADAPGSD